MKFAKVIVERSVSIMGHSGSTTLSGHDKHDSFLPAMTMILLHKEKSAEYILYILSFSQAILFHEHPCLQILV